MYVGKPAIHKETIASHEETIRVIDEFDKVFNSYIKSLGHE